MQSNIILYYIHKITKSLYNKSTTPEIDNYKNRYMNNLEYIHYSLLSS